MNNKRKYISIILIITLLFSYYTINYKIYANKTVETVKGTFNFEDSIEPGTERVIPKEIKQYTAMWESYAKEDVSKQPGLKPGTAQYDVRQLLWEAQNRPIADSGVAYVKVAGQKRYVVALSTIFGLSGDYIDIVLNNGEVIPCIMGDVKSSKTDKPYIFEGDGLFYGHTYEEDKEEKCDIVEFILGINIQDNETPPVLKGFLDKFDKVKSIKNGGSYFLHPDGPVGLSGDYAEITPGVNQNFSNSSSTTSNNKGEKSEEKTFARTFGRFLRSGWIAISTFFDNDRTGRNLSTIMISLSN